MELRGCRGARQFRRLAEHWRELGEGDAIGQLIRMRAPAPVCSRAPECSIPHPMRRGGKFAGTVAGDKTVEAAHVAGQIERRAQ